MGGTASSCDSAPGQFKITDLKDLKIGDTKEMSTGCGPTIDGTQGGSCLDQLKNKGFSWPDNGEFDWGGRGSNCSLCSFNYGCECAGGIAGSRGTVKRTAFNGDATACCTATQAATGNTVLNGKTCNPDSKDFNKTFCDQAMQKYCGNSSNTANPTCQKWITAAVARKLPAVNDILKTYCSQGTNYANTTCQNWASDLKAKDPASTSIDDALQAYCQSNPTDPNCACVAPSANATTAASMMTSPLACWYKPCLSVTSDNYLTSTLASDKSNCSSTLCQLNDSDIVLANNTLSFKNTCGNSLVQSSYRPSPPAAPKVPITPPVSSGTPPVTPPVSGTPPVTPPVSSGTPPVTPPSGTPPSPSPSLSPSSTQEESKSDNTMLYFGGGGLSVCISLSICCIIIMFIIFMMMGKKKTS